MTAQAGAVAAWIAPFDLQSLNACRNDEHNGYVHAWMRPDDIRTLPLYAEQPAAVSVEALEKLVTKLNTLGNDIAGAGINGFGNRAHDLRDELTQLIKERSNG